MSLTTKKAARSGAKGWVTRCHGEVQRLIAVQPPVLEDLVAACADFDNYLEKYDLAQSEVESVIAPEYLEADLDTEFAYRK